MGEESTGARNGWGTVPHRPMRPRDRHEPHRAATPLELLFDLCFVVAVARAGALLAHDIAEGHPGHGLGGYILVFFAIWWAWVNFTWFASAYDTDDPLYRIATFVQIVGVLVFAAGIPRAFSNADFSITIVGYVIMRVALAGQWLRAAHGGTAAARVAALRYAGGLVVVQSGWVGLLFLPHRIWYWAWLALALAELAVPVFAERGHRTSWHPHHIAERYGLFTIIMLGESVAAAALAVQVALAESSTLIDLLPIALGGLLIVFSAYWIYFAVPIHRYLSSSRRAFLWGYGHYLIFGAAAAVGAGLEVAIEQQTHRAHISTIAASAAVTVPTAVFLVAVWMLHARHVKQGVAQQSVLPVGAVLILAATFAGHWAVPVAGLLTAAAIAVGTALEHDNPLVAARRPEN
jgi:low temperature requirement protein LtrA